MSTQKQAGWWKRNGPVTLLISSCIIFLLAVHRAGDEDFQIGHINTTPFLGVSIAVWEIIVIVSLAIYAITVLYPHYTRSAKINN